MRSLWIWISWSPYFRWWQTCYSGTILLGVVGPQCLEGNHWLLQLDGPPLLGVRARNFATSSKWRLLRGGGTSPPIRGSASCLVWWSYMAGSHILHRSLPIIVDVHKMLGWGRALVVSRSFSAVGIGADHGGQAVAGVGPTIRHSFVGELVGCSLRNKNFFVLK